MYSKDIQILIKHGGDTYEVVPCDDKHCDYYGKKCETKGCQLPLWFYNLDMIIANDNPGIKLIKKGKKK